MPQSLLFFCDATKICLYLNTKTGFWEKPDNPSKLSVWWVGQIKYRHTSAVIEFKGKKCKFYKLDTSAGKLSLVMASDFIKDW